MTIPKRYIPKTLSKHDSKKQKKNIVQTRKLYKKKIYKNRPFLKSFKSKPSRHVVKAKKLYKVDKITPSKQLAKATKCSVKGLNRITKKGRGAYYSSGSRPGQSPQSWAYARLYSYILGGPARKTDKSITEKYNVKF